MPTPKKEKTATVKKTAKEKPVGEQVEFETFEETFERVMQVAQEAIAQSDSQPLIPVVEEPAKDVEPVELATQEDPAATKILVELTRHIDLMVEEPTKKKNHPARPIPQAREQFDLNLVVVSGVIGSVWGKNNDVFFVRLALSLRGRLVETDEKFASHITLRFADGMIGGAPISIQPGDVLKIQGYLVHREYQETLRKFLDEANAMSFLDYVDPADLSAWRLLTLERRNGLVIQGNRI